MQGIFSNKYNKTNLFFSLILLGIITRIAIPAFITPLPNFSPIQSIALFCGAYCIRRWHGIVIAIISVWLGDLLINKMWFGHWTFFYSGFYWQYGCYALIALIGSGIKYSIKPFIIVTMSIISALLFYTISNFGVWATSMMYPATFEGLIACYVAAIPFFKNTLFSNLFFSAVLFGSYEWLKRDDFRTARLSLQQIRH